MNKYNSLKNYYKNQNGGDKKNMINVLNQFILDIDNDIKEKFKIICNCNIKELSDTQSYLWIKIISKKIIPELIIKLNNLIETPEINDVCNKIIIYNQFILDVNNNIKNKFIDICGKLQLEFNMITSIDNRPYMWLDIIIKKIIPDLKNL